MAAHEAKHSMAKHGSVATHSIATHNRLWWKVVAVLVSVAMIFTMSNVFAYASGNTSLLNINSSKSSDDGSFYYVAIGDSVCSGYGLDEKGAVTKTEFPEYNYKNSPKTSYPVRVAEYIYNNLVEDGYIEDQGSFENLDNSPGSTEGFKWSNMGGSGYSTSDLIGTLTDDTYIALMWRMWGMEKYFSPEHDLYVSEIKKADLITLNIGGDNLLIDSLYQMITKAYGSSSEPEYISLDDKIYLGGYNVGEDGNPALAMIEDILQGLLCGTLPEDQIEYAITTELNFYLGNDEEHVCTHTISTQDVIDLMEYMDPDNLSDRLQANSAAAVEDINTIVELIKEINPDVAIAYVGFYNPYGSNLTVNSSDGTSTTYDLASILQRTLTNIKDAVKSECATTVDQAAILDTMQSLITADSAVLAEAMQQASDYSSSLDIASISASDVEKATAQSNLETLSGGTTSIPEFDNLADFVTWTKENYENWQSWDNATWNTWVEHVKSYGTDYNDIVAIADALDTIADNNLLSSDATIEEVVQAVSELTGSDYEVIYNFISHSVRNMQDFVYGDGSSLKALAKELRDNAFEYIVVLFKFMFISQEAQQEVYDKFVNDLEYPSMYTIIGIPSDAAIKTLNAGLEQKALSENAPYIDIYGIANKVDVDPHPNAEGHDQLACMIDDGITKAVSVTTNEGGTAYVANDTGIYGAGIKVTVKVDENYHVSSITNNGNEVALTELSTNSDGTQTFIAEVDNSGANVTVNFAKGTAPVQVTAPDTSDSMIYVIASLVIAALAASTALVTFRRKLR